MNTEYEDLPTLNTSVLEKGEQYATALHISNVQDLPCLPVDVPYWTENETPCKLPVRALSFKYRRMAREKAKSSDDMLELYTALYALRDVLDVSKEAEMIAMLEGKHPLAISRIAKMAALLGRVDVAFVKQHVADILGIENEKGGA